MKYFSSFAIEVYNWFSEFYWSPFIPADIGVEVDESIEVEENSLTFKELSRAEKENSNSENEKSKCVSVSVRIKWSEQNNTK